MHDVIEATRFNLRNMLSAGGEAVIATAAITIVSFTLNNPAVR